MTIRIKALVAAYGLKRGDVADVQVTASTDAMINNGFWRWIDQPAAEPELVEVTEVVKARKPRAKKADNETETVTLDDRPFSEAPVLVEHDEAVDLEKHDSED